MALPNSPPCGPPLGFPQCPNCTYLRTGPPDLCLDCASRSVETIAADACPICSQRLDGANCPNWLCADPTRSIVRIRAIAYSSGALRDTILRYKYDRKWGWSLIFGRLLLAWLNQNERENPPDLIVANPTYAAGGDVRLGHIERVIDKAATEDVQKEWPFDTADPPAIIKTDKTKKSAGNDVWEKRAAATELRAALAIPDRSRVEGHRILVYDDVCTTASQLNAVAACLIEDGGATSVEGIVLARAPWRAMP